MPTVKQVIERVYTKVNGEYEAITVGSDDWNTYLNVLNQVMETWADWPYVKWQSLYDMNYTLPDPVALGQHAYPVADSNRLILANSPFDSVYFIDSNGDVVRTYTMVNQTQFDRLATTDICAWFGDMLHLKSVSDDIVGTSIRLPVYVKPVQYTTATQPVAIDSISWLTSYMAAYICDASPVPFIARNADKFYKQADVFMKAMKDNNNHAQHLVVKKLDDTSPRTWDDVLAIMSMKDL